MVCSSVRTFSDEHGPGTFHSLGTLPKRRTPSVFHFHDDDDHAVPFPRTTSPLSSSPTSPPSPPPPPRPASSALLRGVSAPVLLSNGKPLKSSLKLSTSSPILTKPKHLRARSEPSTPKNVHFPEKDCGLATVCVFNCRARPAALSNPANGNGDETETEGEDSPPIHFRFAPHSHAINYEIDPVKSSPLPPTFSLPANLLLESFGLSSSSACPKPMLTGSILVRNFAFQKYVAIRFSLDEWQTVSEVCAHYTDSLSSLPSQIFPLPSDSTSDDPASERGRGWDRFAFTIRLEDYAPSLSTRTMWLAARYQVDSTYPLPGTTEHGPGGEWWDNNSGNNYRLGFRPAIFPSTSPRIKLRGEFVSAPITSLHTQPQPATINKENVMGLMIPSLPKPKEIRSLNETDRHSAPLRVGKLNLCNYVPPAVHATSAALFPSADSPSSRSSSLITKPKLPSSATVDDSASPASSTLSTPSDSPTITPRMIVNGRERVDLAMTHSGPVHIADWDRPAPSKPGTSRRCTDPLPVSENSSPSGKALSGNSLYEAFVTKWCFAQGPSPSPHCYDASGIVA